MNKLCVVGLGWLGQPLADLYCDVGWQVSGTTRNQEKIKQLAEKNIKAFLFDLYTNETTSLPSQNLKDGVLVLNIPPGRKNFNESAYTTSMMQLIDHCFESGLRHLIFISTTAVFGNQHGLIDETTQTQPKTPSGRAHQQIENYLLSKYAQNACVIRPSGLVGELRHPALSLSKKTGIALGKNPVNLIHLKDVIKVIEAVINNEVSGRAFNLATLDHPSREDYYTWCCKQLCIQTPGFEKDFREGKAVDGKVIDMQHTLDALHISLAYPSVFDFPLPD